jgi:hypothetical protein
MDLDRLAIFETAAQNVISDRKLLTGPEREAWNFIQTAFDSVTARSYSECGAF